MFIYFNQLKRVASMETGSLARLMVKGIQMEPRGHCTDCMKPHSGSAQNNPGGSRAWQAGDSFHWRVSHPRPLHFSDAASKGRVSSRTHISLVIRMAVHISELWFSWLKGWHRSGTLGLHGLPFIKTSDAYHFYVSFAFKTCDSLEETWFAVYSFHSL